MLDFFLLLPYAGNSKQSQWYNSFAHQKKKKINSTTHLSDHS